MPQKLLSDLVSTVGSHRRKDNGYMDLQTELPFTSRTSQDLTVFQPLYSAYRAAVALRFPYLVGEGFL